MVQPVGLEPTTNELKVHCSTLELWLQKMVLTLRIELSFLVLQTSALTNIAK